MVYIFILRALLAPEIIADFISRLSLHALSTRNLYTRLDRSFDNVTVKNPLQSLNSKPLCCFGERNGAGVEIPGYIRGESAKWTLETSLRKLLIFAKEYFFPVFLLELLLSLRSSANDVRDGERSEMDLIGSLKALV